jgi:hypothetical protein
VLVLVRFFQGQGKRSKPMRHVLGAGVIGFGDGTCHDRCKKESVLDFRACTAGSRLAIPLAAALKNATAPAHNALERRIAGTGLPCGLGEDSFHVRANKPIAAFAAVPTMFLFVAV